MTDVDVVLHERGQRYGQFEDHAFIAQVLKSVMTGDFHGVRILLNSGEPQPDRVRGALYKKWRELAPDQREALDMNAHKIARILNGDANYADSWVDIAGYAQLVGNRLVRDQEAAANV